MPRALIKEVWHPHKGGKLTMPQSLPQHIAWLERQRRLLETMDSCLKSLQNAVMKEVSQSDAIEVPRQLPVPISLADGHYPGPRDASDNGCVYGGVILCLRRRHCWHWRFTHYTLLEDGGFTHWLPPDVECLPVRVEP